MGDTDRTPDGGFSAGFLEYGGANLRKAAAYTYQALLDLAATTLGVDKSSAVRQGRRRLRRRQDDLVRRARAGQELKLTIPVTGDLTSMFGLTVTGNPPMKPTSEYTIIGKSYANSVTPSKVSAKEMWVTDVRLPGMLHGRVVHPKTLGSTLVSVGDLNKTRYPERAGRRQRQSGRRRRANRVGSDRRGAADCGRHDSGPTGKGCPATTQLYTWMREEADWKTTPVAKSDEEPGRRRAGARAPPRRACPRPTSCRS